MTVHRDKLNNSVITFLVNKTNTRTEFQIYWYYYSTCFGQSFCPSSGVLCCIAALVRLCSCDGPFATMSRMELHEFHPAPGSKGHQNCINVPMSLYG